MHSALHISDPEPAVREEHTSATNSSKRSKILIGLGVGALVLGGVGAALALTIFKSKSADGSSSSLSPTYNSAGEADGYARGYVAPPDAEEILAELNAAAFVAPLVAALPTAVDWRTKPNIVTPVKNQGGCGSCWAVSAIQNMEASYGMKYNKQVILSPQQLVDCDLSNGGCNGGWPLTAWQKYFKNNARPYSLFESQYPYTIMSPNGKTRNTCAIGDDSRGPVMVTSSTNVMATQTWSLQAEQTVMGYIAQNGPVTIAVSATGNFAYYKGGIATTQSLGCTNQLNHGISLVGFGEENGKPYWIVRNTWGAAWGENGYIRLARGANTCCILCAVMSVTVASTGASAPVTKAPVTSPPSTSSRLNANSQLNAGSQLSSPDGTKILKLQTDGNLVLFKTAYAAAGVTQQAIWSTNTIGSGSMLKMHTDCNLMLETSAGKGVWNSGSTRTGDSQCATAYLAVQNDGTLAIYKGTTIIWTNNKPTSSPATTTTPKPAAKSLSVSVLGCYKDDASRVLKTRLSAANNAVLRDCAYLAYNTGLQYFGLAYGGECWGGDATFNRLGTSTACTMKCIGDTSQTCGGSWALTMYKVVATSAFTESPVYEELPAPVTPLVLDHQCTMYQSRPTYCWKCVNNVEPEIECQDVTVSNINTDVDLAGPSFVYPGLCPQTFQNATTICQDSLI